VDEDFEDRFRIDYGLPMNEKRRYAKAKRCFELGIWGRDLALIKGVELTTRLGHRNNWLELKQDNKDLRKKLRKEGWFEADCFCAEVSAKNHLLHLHGFYRLNYYMEAAEVHRLLSDYWDAIHGAPVVWVQDIYSFKGLMMYNVKHALKNYVNLEFGYLRMLKSKGWLPLGWKPMLKVLVKWALEHRAKFNAEEVENYLEEADYEDGVEFLDSYVPMAWEVMNDYIWRWCHDEIIMLDFKGYGVTIEGDKIREFERSG